MKEELLGIDRERLENETPLQDAYNRIQKAQERLKMKEDNWAGRSQGMRCATCIWWVEKAPQPIMRHKIYPLENMRVEEVPMNQADRRAGIGRCRRHAPTMSGFPVVYESDWCGDHKIDEGKV